jgi:coproporphyrinogen III oxidase-like Fe-S oxidoreductase
MKILVTLIEKANDTMDEIEFYAEKAHALRATHKSLADAYIEIAEAHISIYKLLHKEMVELIEEQKRNGKVPTPEMLAFYEYTHERLIKEFAETKYLIDDYKKSY